MIDAALLAQLLAAAVRLSGHAPLEVAELPRIQVLSAPAMREVLCPEGEPGCDQIVAIYEPERARVLVSQQLDLSHRRDQSFVVHELVHVLQHRQDAARYQRDCAATLEAERAAYAVQNRFLREHGDRARFGAGLLGVRCAADQSGPPGSMRLEPSGVPMDDLAFDAFMYGQPRPETGPEPRSP